MQMDQQIGGALWIAAITSTYAFAAVPGRFASGLPAVFIDGAIVAAVAAIVAWQTGNRALAGRTDLPAAGVATTALDG